MLMWTTWTPERDLTRDIVITGTGPTWGLMPPWGTVTTSSDEFLPPPRPATRGMLRLALCR